MAAQAGILFADDHPVSQDVLRTLSSVNASLGSDVTGTYVSPGLAMLSFGLHFDSLSRSEHQPVTLTDGSVLTWDGRLDNRDDFIVRLDSTLTDYSTDAHIMALAISKWDDASLCCALGDWSLAYWNASSRELLLARDYVGNRPLYYCERPDFVAWSTALDPLVEICKLSGQLSDEFMARWLTHNTTGDLTLYRGLLQVPAGHALRIKPGSRAACRSFIRFKPQVLRYREAGQYEEHYRELFTTAVRVRLRACAPVWSELSGGYDSSSVTGMALRLVRSRAVEAPHIQPVSLIPSESPESDESWYIERFERFHRVDSLRVRWGGAIVALDQPAPYLAATSLARVRDTSLLPRDTYEAAARAGAHVLLSGEFGDDITSGATAEDGLLDHIRMLRFRAFLMDSLDYCRVDRRSLPHLWKEFAFHNLSSLIPFKRRRPSLSRMTWATVRHVSPDDVATIFGLQRQFIERAWTSLRSRDYGISDMPRDAHRLIWRLCQDVEEGIFSGACGLGPLRVTYPFSHRPLVSFVLSLPSSIMWRPEHPRAFACAALRDVLPEEVIRRRTKGYAPPAIIRNLTPCVTENVAKIGDWQLVSRGYGEPSTIAQIFKAFLDGSQATEALVRRLIDAESLLRCA